MEKEVGIAEAHSCPVSAGADPSAAPGQRASFSVVVTLVSVLAGISWRNFCCKMVVN